jgi:FkbM family methyltransferase
VTVIRDYPTPKGGTVRMALRPDTADEPVISATSIADEYGVADFDLRPGELFLDVGAYIGSVGLAVAKDFPEAKVVMIEAVPENVAVISESIAHNGWRERVFVYHAAAAKRAGVTTIMYGAGVEDSSYQKDNRYVGNLGALNETHAVRVTNMTLGNVIEAHGPVSVLKIDCEGCEYAFLDSPHVASVRHLVGEWHHGGRDRIMALLGPTHDVTIDDDPIVGLFWAKRR